MFDGVFTALVTPFSSDGARVDPGRLAANIAAQAEAGVRGVVPCGTTGESPTLTDEEQRQVIRKTIDAARASGLLVVAGAGSNNTAHAIELHRFSHEAGADAALHVCPYYNKPSQEGLYRHFMALAESCDLPIVLYNIPGRCGTGLTLQTIGRLAAHGNIRAIKEASGSITLAGQIVRGTALAVLSGDDPLTLPLMAIGATGVVSVLSNVLPDRVSALCRAVADGDLIEARRLHLDLLPLAEALLTIDTNPVPVKTALRILGRDSGTVRLPLTQPSPEATLGLQSVLADYATPATMAAGRAR